MFVNVLNKTFFVNRSCHYKEENCFKYIDFDYDKTKQEFPTLGKLYEYILSLNLTRSIMIFIIPNNDYNQAIIDYCNYLGLDFDAYLAMKKHSDFCTRYVDYCYENISTDEKCIPQINEECFNKPRRIKNGYEIFPAELAINCLDKEWSINKFTSLRAYGLYNKLNKVRIDLYINNKDPDDYSFLDMFEKSDQSAKYLMSEVNYNAIKNNLLTRGLIQQDSIYNNTVKYFADHTKDGGYDPMHIFKYNGLLARCIKKSGYRIDKE